MRARTRAREGFISDLFAHPFSRFSKKTFWKMRLQGNFSKHPPQNIGHFLENFRLSQKNNGHFLKSIGHFHENIGYFCEKIRH